MITWRHAIFASGAMLLPITAFQPAIADDLRFRAGLSGKNEIPPVKTKTSGVAEFEVDDGRSEIEFELEIEDGERVLAGPGEHIHCGSEFENGPIAAFLTADSREDDNNFGYNGDVEIEATLDDTNVEVTDCGRNIRELVQSMIDGNTYVNIHSSEFPGGVIRGQIKLIGNDDDDD